MKKIESKKRTLKVHKETLLNLATDDLKKIRAGAAVCSTGGQDTGGGVGACA